MKIPLEKLIKLPERKDVPAFNLKKYTDKKPEDVTGTELQLYIQNHTLNTIGYRSHNECLDSLPKEVETELDRGKVAKAAESICGCIGCLTCARIADAIGKALPELIKEDK